MSSDDLVELHVIFYGKVQGVGFRWTVVERAERFQLVGTVCNLKNGTVEAVIVGKKEDCEKLIESLKMDSPATLEKINVQFSKSINNNFFNFKII